MNFKALSLPRVVSPEVTFRILNADEMELSVDGRILKVPLFIHHLLLEFVHLRSPADVYAELETDLDEHGFAEIIATMDQCGALVSASTARSEEPGAARFADELAGGALNDRAVLEAVAAGLAAGRAVTLCDALEPSFAETLHRELGEMTSWQAFEGSSAQYAFHFRQHHVFEPAAFPPSLQRCMALFGSANAKQFMSGLSGRDCSGAIQLGASVYLPGDFSLPHSDSGFPRTVAFVLHLTKDWDPRWGGGLFWCPSGLQILPKFNRLTLFNVTRAGTHFVAPVSAQATGRRFGVSGWWTERLAEAPVATPTAPKNDLPDGFEGECYSATAPRVIGTERRIVIL